jgi:membrane protein
MGVSLVLGLGVGACFLLAIAVLTLVPLLHGDLGAAGNAAAAAARWALTGGLLLAAVALLIHFAPEQHQPIGWVSFGSGMIMVAWLAMSAGFGFYLREIASYGSVFSNLATIVVLIGYVYASVVIFLGGVQVDALVRERRENASTMLPG